MKKTISIIALALAVILMMSCLSACGSRLPAAGTYKLVDVTGDNTESIAAVKDLVTMEVKADGTATLDMGGYYSAEYTFEKDSNKVTVSGNVTNSTTYTVNGNKLTIGEDGSSLVFEKQ